MPAIFTAQNHVGYTRLIQDNKVFSKMDQTMSIYLKWMNQSFSNGIKQ